MLANVSQLEVEKEWGALKSRSESVVLCNVIKKSNIFDSQNHHDMGILKVSARVKLTCATTVCSRAV